MEIYHGVIQLVAVRLEQLSARATKAQLSEHVQMFSHLFIVITVKAKQNFHQTWMVMEKSFVNSLRLSDAYIRVSSVTIIGSDNGLSPDPRQAIIWTNAGILLIGPLGTNFSEIEIKIHTFSFKKMHLKMSSRNGSHFVSASMC